MGRVGGKVAPVAGAGGVIGGAGAESLAREGAAAVCADIDGAAAEIIAARIRAAGDQPTGIARAERGRPFSSPRGGTTAVFRGVQGLGRCGESAVAQIRR
jgi:NAD(P)-dependent dehydrogenase (short-subunit alcohol dehydrogenase family)